LGEVHREGADKLSIVYPHTVVHYVCLGAHG
jgi:hypothetical protein